MLKQQTREKLQALINHPGFVGSISVGIDDRKVIHSIGKPSILVDVNIHAYGLNALDLLGELVPELQIINRQPYRTEHDTHISSGEIAEGLIEKARVNVWATYADMPIEKAPTAMGAIEEIIHSDYTPNEEVVANG